MSLPQQRALHAASAKRGKKCANHELSTLPSLRSLISPLRGLECKHNHFSFNVRSLLACVSEMPSLRRRLFMAFKHS